MKAAVFKNALDIEVYRACIKALKTHVAVPGVVGDSLKTARVDEHRVVDVRYLRPDKGHYLVGEWLSDFMKQYGDLKPAGINVLTYTVGGLYDWHVDGSGDGYRKYSFISILNPPNEYDGGELEIEGIELPEYAYDPLSVIVFNPALKHRVKPITRGIRHSLVTWFKEKALPRKVIEVHGHPI